MKHLFFLGLALLSATLSFGQNNALKAEVFIQIPDRGIFTVYLDNEFIGSSSGRFRFYNVNNATPTLSVFQGTTVLFKKRISAQEGQRTIAQFSQRGGFKVLSQLGIYRNGVYALNDWDDYAGAYNTGIVPPARNSKRLSATAYTELYNRVKAESFDEGKMKLMNAVLVSAPLSTAMLKELLGTFNFEYNKLTMANNAYANCADKENYFTLVDIFSFKTNKEALLDFISRQQ